MYCEMYQSLRDESESETEIHTFLTHIVLMLLVGGWLVPYCDLNRIANCF